MQINSYSAAAQAASITSPVNKNTEQQVENSGSADSDRDAQGQGDGLGDRRKRKDQSAEPETTDTLPLTGELPGEEPGQLDIIG